VHDQPDRIIEALAARGIGSRGYYRTPLHRQPAMAPYGAGLELPVTEELARTNLALPMSPKLGPDAAAEVVAAIAGLET
jgi:dTDP-4-amino-4,6-dideoxygalactose transaminase